MNASLRLRSLAAVLVSLLVIGGGVSLADVMDPTDEDPTCVVVPPEDTDGDTAEDVDTEEGSDEGESEEGDDQGESEEGDDQGDETTCPEDTEGDDDGSEGEPVEEDADEEASEDAGDEASDVVDPRAGGRVQQGRRHRGGP